MSETKKNSWSTWGVSPVAGKEEKLWRKGFVEEMSFEPGVKERTSDGR